MKKNHGGRTSSIPTKDLIQCINYDSAEDKWTREQNRVQLMIHDIRTYDLCQKWHYRAKRMISFNKLYWAIGMHMDKIGMIPYLN